ncbi:MAG: hypothetical protein WAM97_15365 [Acidimicrobiales bacterium]|jgi:hypothetical protein
MRLHLRPLSILAAIGVVVLCAGCSSGPSAGGLSGESANQIIDAAQAAMGREASFHFADVTGSGSKAQTLSGEAGQGEAEQSLIDPDGDLFVRQVDSAIYLRGSADVLVSALGLSSTTAAQYAGKWIEITSKEVPYETVAKTLLPTSEVTPYVPVSGLTVGAPRVLGGHDVVPVSGQSESSNGNTAVATLYVSTSAPYLPLDGTLKGTGSEKNDTEESTFRWAGKVSVPAPSGAVAYSSLATAS